MCMIFFGTMPYVFVGIAFRLGSSAAQRFAQHKALLFLNRHSLCRGTAIRQQRRFLCKSEAILEAENVDRIERKFGIKTHKYNPVDVEETCSYKNYSVHQTISYNIVTTGENTSQNSHSLLTRILSSTEPMFLRQRKNPQPHLGQIAQCSARRLPKCG